MFVCILLLFDQSVESLVIGGFNASADKSFNLNLAILKELDLITIAGLGSRPFARHIPIWLVRTQIIADGGCDKPKVFVGSINGRRRAQRPRHLFPDPIPFFVQDGMLAIPRLPCVLKDLRQIVPLNSYPLDIDSLIPLVDAGELNANTSKLG
jgi:hypothetical protein